MLHGVRDEPATRALIVQENMRYARRQLIWFRKEPNVRWLDGAGETAAVQSAGDGDGGAVRRRRVRVRSPGSNLSTSTV